MSAVVRLVLSYFAATPLSRASTFGGIALIVISLYVVTNVPQSEHMLAFAFLGQIALFVASSGMPLMVGRLAQSQTARLLPWVRVKLLASVLLTIAIVALPAGLLTPAIYVAGNSGSLSDLAKYPQLLAVTIDLALLTYTLECIIAGWLYLALWFLSSERNMAGVSKGLLVILFLMVVPASEIREFSVAISRNLVQLAIAWTVFGTLFLAWPRLRPWFARWRSPWRPAIHAVSGRAAGREVDLLLGTANPWLLVAALAVPLAIFARLHDVPPGVWLFFLTIFSVVTGAVAGQAAERSRPLWLRAGWSRAELFARVEQSFWRHNGLVLGILLALMIVIGSYSDYPPALMLAGLPLLLLGTALTTYLGLMLTRGLQWLEALLGVAIMAGLMFVPLMLGAEKAAMGIVIAFEAALAVAVVGLRLAARRRWLQIDWTRCRPERAWRARRA